MKSKIALFIVAGTVVSNLSACSQAAKYFPDKERDYQRTKEIPMLTLPTDLRAHPAPTLPATPVTEPTPEPSSNTAITPPISDATQTPAATTDSAPKSENPTSASNPTLAAVSNEPSASEEPIPTREDAILANAPNANDPTTEEPVADTKPITVEQIKKDGSSRLRINSNLLKSWRLVGKALSRKSLDVTERNQEKSQYTVQYDPDEKKAQDGSLMDEVRFIFKGFQINEQQYHIKLVESSDYTEVVIIDKDQKPLSDTPASVKLFDLLEKTIKENLAEK
jgi:outer membrane protein assembly factor BamC